MSDFNQSTCAIHPCGCDFNRGSRLDYNKDKGNPQERLHRLLRLLHVNLLPLMPAAISLPILQRLPLLKTKIPLMPLLKTRIPLMPLLKIAIPLMPLLKIRIKSRFGGFALGRNFPSAKAIIKTSHENSQNME